MSNSSHILPIDLDQCHWGLLLMERIVDEDDYEQMVVEFGDTLRFQFPMHMKRFLEGLIENCLTLPSGEVWKYDRKNYVLDISGYKRQNDSYSCGACVISNIAEGGRSRGCCPNLSLRD